MRRGRVLVLLNVVGLRSKRRYRSKQERRQVVEETLQPGKSAAVTARQHGVNASQVFHWRWPCREGRLDGSFRSSGIIRRVNDLLRDVCDAARLAFEVQFGPAVFEPLSESFYGFLSSVL